MNDRVDRVLFLPDIHAPYHDKRAWKLVGAVASAFKWHTICQLGDFYDCYAVSSYSKDPKKIASLKREVNAGRKCLDDLNAIKADRKLITSGNHEHRVERYLQDKAPELYDEIMGSDLFGFEKSKWEVYAYREHAKIGRLFVTHDVAANGATAVLNAVQDNIVTGHDHKMNMVVQGTALGIMHVSATFGWLGDVEHASYMHSLKARRQWALGMGVGYLRDDGVIYLHPVPVVRYSCVVEGRLFRA